MGKSTGIIKSYNSNKGYGFIKNKDEQIFFHISDVYEKEKISEGIVVTYSKDKDKKNRDKATGIRIVADGKEETVIKLDNHIDRLCDVTQMIEPHKLTILTGSNGGGKSFIRKLMNSRMGEEFPNRDLRKLVTEVSMQKRTDANNPLMGTGFGYTFFDNPQFPTSMSTYRLINRLLDSCIKEDDDKKAYIVIDEPEIGMAEESQLGIAMFLKDKMSKILMGSLGILIITHSKIIVNELKDVAKFIYLDCDMSADEWLNRKIVPTNFTELDTWSMYLWQRLKDRMVQ